MIDRALPLKEAFGWKPEVSDSRNSVRMSDVDFAAAAFREILSCLRYGFSGCGLKGWGCEALLDVFSLMRFPA